MKDTRYSNHLKNLMKLLITVKIYLKRNIEYYIKRRKTGVIKQLCLAQFTTYYYKELIDDEPSQLSTKP